MADRNLHQRKTQKIGGPQRAELARIEQELGGQAGRDHGVYVAQEVGRESPSPNGAKIFAPSHNQFVLAIGSDGARATSVRAMVCSCRACTRKAAIEGR